MTRRALKSINSSRVGGSHVRTGCLTCKIRHVKCDEEKPTCLRCRSTGRVCDGYVHKGSLAHRITTSHAPVVRELASLKQTILPNPSNSLPGTDRERRSFHYYVLEIGQDVCGSMKLSALHQIIYQLSHTNPAIREAVSAIGSFGERLRIHRLLTRENQQANECHGYALSQYGIALKHLQQDMVEGLHQSRSQTLIACFLFILFEFLQGNEIGALAHLRNGLRILHGVTEKRATKMGAAWSERFAISFKRDSADTENLDLSIKEVREVCACGQHQKSVHTNNTAEGLVSGLDGLCFPTLQPVSPLPDAAACELLRAFVVMENCALTWLGLETWEHPLLAPFGVRDHAPMYLDHFASVGDAMDSLKYQMNQAVDLRRCFISIDHLESRIHLFPIIRKKQQELLHQLERWLSALENLRVRLGSLNMGDTHHRMVTMRINYEITHINLILLGLDCVPIEVLDTLEPRFRKITTLSRSILEEMDNDQLSRLPPFVLARPNEISHNTVFTFSAGLIQPLYLTAVKCGNAMICDEAIDLLSSRPWRESAWDSSVMAGIAKNGRARKQDSLRSSRHHLWLLINGLQEDEALYEPLSESLRTGTEFSKSIRILEVPSEASFAKKML